MWASCSPGFGRPSTLVAEYGAGRVSAFEVDANGDPLIGTPRNFLGLGGTEGAALDPLTNDFCLLRLQQQQPQSSWYAAFRGRARRTSITTAS